MTKEEYKQYRIDELGSYYRSHTTSKSDSDKIIAMECGEWPRFRGRTSFEFTLNMLLKCKHTELEIADALNEEFPNNDNTTRAHTVRNAFSGGKCRNVTAYRYNEVIGLKWDRYKFFSPTGEWVKDTEVISTYEDRLCEFNERVGLSFRDNRQARIQRLRNAETIPTATTVQTTYYPRNPDVVAEVLHRADGICERCQNPAPFTRIKDGSLYLEVHHNVKLSDGGEDTVQNAVALCPNCHRYYHYGQKDT